MPSLLELQDTFATALAYPARGPEAVAHFRGPPDRVLSCLAIYRGNVHANRAQALSAAYPVVRKIVGAEFFEAMVRQYDHARRPASADLNRLGGDFPGFLEEFTHAADLPYLPDVARMEWLVHRAHFSRDAAPFDGASLAGIPVERYPLLRPRLAFACALLESAWPLGRIWEIHQDDFEGEFTIDLGSGPDRILVHRPRWRARVLSLSPGDSRFLNVAASGGTLGEALEAAVSEDRDFDSSGVLARWIEAGVITGLDAEEKR